MASKKQTTIDNGTTSKGKSIVTFGGTNPPNIRSRGLTAQHHSSPQGAIGDVRSPSLYEGQFLQMFADMKEEMEKQRPLTDREREQATLDCENAAREREALNLLNDRLLAQITTLEATMGQPQQPVGPIVVEIQLGDPIRNRRQSRSASRTPTDRSNNRSGSSHLHTRDQLG